MKISFQHRHAGLTLIEVIAIIATLVLMAIFLLFVLPLAKVSGSANRITCVNNLKQIHLSFRLYAGDDNRNRYPMNTSTNAEPIVNEATPVFEYLKLISEPLSNPRVVICPSDTNRILSTDFTNFNNSNISYFIGLDSDDNRTNSMMTGDRNITNGFSPKGWILGLTTKQKVSFTEEIHIKQGNVALGDGSVRQVTSKQLRSEILPNTGFVTNRILLP